MVKDKPPSGKTLSPEDRSLWDFVTRNIRPLLHRNPVPEPPAPDRRREAPPVPALPELTPDFGLKTSLPAAARPGEGEGFAGLDRRSADRLRRGQMAIEGRLDLHGLRQAEAQEQLTRFLLRGYQDGRRCVLVITGKGVRSSPSPAGEAGILRRMVPYWLQMPPLAPLILSHCPARPKDGGDGAFYILLRRKR